MYKPHTHCRACGYAAPGPGGTKSPTHEQLLTVFDLGVQPMANDFAHDGEERAGHAPLKVLFCPRCSLAQLSVVVRPEELYRNYRYVTSNSDMMRTHFARLIADIKEETSKKDVLEIGSNDGNLLRVMQAQGFVVSGIDPAENLAPHDEDITTHVGFFGTVSARCLATYDIVIARHVFCHIPDWQDFMEALKFVTRPSGIVCIEVPYVGDLLTGCEFDTIYHEHLSYLSIKAMQALLEKSAFRLHRIIRYPIHGGALLLILRHKESPLMPDPSVEVQENFTAESWREFSVEARAQIDRLRASVDTLVAQGNSVAGLGASAKSTVWVNACGFTRKQIRFIADSTPQKQFTFSPGSDIPIVDEGAIWRELPDYVVMWAWNYRDEILAKFAAPRDKGVKFIIPVPKISVV